jgi:diketogulonate reductase-like aldo/keto reductase
LENYASDVGVDAVLFQEVADVDRPILFFSKKLDQHQANYSTIEKECFALLSALQPVDVYLSMTMHPIFVENFPKLLKLYSNKQLITMK